MQAASGWLFTATRTPFRFSELHSVTRSIVSWTCEVAASPTSLAKPRTSLCNASKSARNELKRLCIIVFDVFTVLVFRLRRLFAVAIIPSAFWGCHVAEGTCNAKGGFRLSCFAAQRMEEQCLADGRLDGLRQERFGNQISRLRAFAGEQPLGIGGDKNHRNIKAVQDFSNRIDARSAFPEIDIGKN